MRKVIQQLKQYKRDTLSCIGLTALEVIMEILMPFITAIIIDQGVEAGNLPVVYRYGVLMVLMAFLALLFGALAGKNAASAATGLSANLREAIYANIQTCSFSNIDNHQRAERIYDESPCGGPCSFEPDFQFRHVSDHQPAFERHVPDCRGFPGGGYRYDYGGYAENLQTGIPQI